MQVSPIQLKEKLLKALDEDQNVRFYAYLRRNKRFKLCINLLTKRGCKKSLTMSENSNFITFVMVYIAYFQVLVNLWNLGFEKKALMLDLQLQQI